MPQIITNEAGEEIEVYTQAETEAMLSEKVEAISEEKQAELDAIAAEKLEIEDELQKLRNKDMNFRNLEKKAAGKEVEVSEEIKSQISSLEEKINQLAAQPKNDVKQDFVKQFIGEDKEQSERFEYYYERLGSEAKTKDEVLKAAQEALTLASGGEYKPDLTSGMYSTGVNQNYRNTPTGEVSETSKEIGNLFGITPEDRKKYGKK